MKRVPSLLILALFALSTSLSAQRADNTLFSDVDVIGGFGGPIIEFSSFNGEINADVGGGGGIIIDNFFLGGYGLEVKTPSVLIDEADYEIDFSHGGFWLGYTYRPDMLFHIFGNARLGWGGLDIVDDLDNDDAEVLFSDRVFVATPELGLELNVTNFFRIAFTGGYRFTTGLSNDLPGTLQAADFNSPTGTITFRFGGFGNYEENWGDY